MQTEQRPVLKICEWSARSKRCTFADAERGEGMKMAAWKSRCLCVRDNPSRPLLSPRRPLKNGSKRQVVVNSFGRAEKRGEFLIWGLLWLLPKLLLSTERLFETLFSWREASAPTSPAASASRPKSRWTQTRGREPHKKKRVGGRTGGWNFLLSKKSYTDTHTLT